MLCCLADVGWMLLRCLTTLHVYVYVSRTLAKMSEDLAIMLLATILTNAKYDEDGYCNRRTVNVP